MTKSRNFKRALIVIAALALIICFAQTVVFAANTVNVKDGSYSNGTISVTGSIGTKGAEMTMLAVRTNNENVQLSDYETPDALAADVQYIDQVTATDDNFEKTWTFELRENTEGSYSHVVVFVSGTDANTVSLAIPLDEKNGVNGTVTFANGSDFVDNAPTFEAAGGDDNWKGQLEGTVKDASGNPVEATVDITAGTITMEAPFEKTSYTVTITNTSDDYPDFTASKTFTLISADGAAAAEAIEELNALPADLGVNVDKGDDAYTITIPDNTDNITYTVTVAGEEVTDRPVVVNRAEEGGDTQVVTVKAAANGTDAVKTHSVNVPAKGVVGPAITEADVTIIADEEGETITDVYKKFIGKGNIIVTIAEGEIDPETQNVKVNGKDFYYVAKRNYFVGIVPAADKAAIIDAVEIGDGASDAIEYGKDPIEGDPGTRLDNGDWAAIKKISLNKVAHPTDKQLLASDVSDGVMDGVIDNGDFADVKKVALRKVKDLLINTVQ
ncbi:MAG: hypothetical protein J5590_01665 [Clostridia bacterium]|nr:hypothetical protein [Clostridia bacterium]